MSQAPKMIPARGVAPSSAASHSSKTVASAVSRSMSSLCPTAIRNMSGSVLRSAPACGRRSDGIEPVAVAIRAEAPDRRDWLVAENDQPILLDGASEQLALDLDRV